MVDLATTTSTLLDELRAAVPGTALEALPAIDMPTIAVDRDRLVDVCRALRDDVRLQFALLADVTAVDRLPVHHGDGVTDRDEPRLDDASADPAAACAQGARHAGLGERRDVTARRPRAVEDEHRSTDGKAPARQVVQADAAGDDVATVR